MNQRIKKENATAGRARMADEAETAQYIGDLVLQLERLAATHGLIKLQYLLRSCEEEARRLSSGAPR